MIEDIKIASGLAGVATAAWVQAATQIGQLVLTGAGIIVAVLTAWYTWERITRLRKERKEKK